MSATPEEAAPFRLGELQVRPASREIEGPQGAAMLEPRVMQVLLALAQARGEVVGREALMARCWPGLVVGEDSLTRAIGELRKALRVTGGGVSIDTITKTGYRLRIEPASGDASVAGAPADAAPGPAPATPTRRRLLLTTAGLGTLGLGGWATWQVAFGSDESRAKALVIQATAVMRDDRWGALDPVVLLREAIRLRPRDAKAWGLLALALHDVATDTEQPEARAIADCHLAADEALKRDPNQADALVALATLDPIYTDWLAAERRFTTLSKRFPDHERLLEALAGVHAATGRAGDVLRLRTRLAALEPLSPAYAAEVVGAHWAAGDVETMNRVADAARRTWPDSNQVWGIRIVTLGYTGRPVEALEMIEQRNGFDHLFPPQMGRAVVAVFQALAGRGNVEAAVAAVMAATVLRQSAAIAAIPVLAALDAHDEAFALADAYFLGRGPIKLPYRFGATEPTAREARHRHTAPLFLPHARSLWPDPRFAELCTQIGLIDYWRAAGVQPDLLGTRPLAI